MSVRRRLKGKKIPPAFSQIEEVIEDFEAQMRDAVAADHAGKRRAESAWAVHRIHWEKNRFIHDLMYVRKAMDKPLFDWLVREKVADGALISKWRKPGYEILCSLLAIQKSGHNFGTTSHCRVPMKSRAPAQRIQPDVQTGCICCASGDGRFGGPIWWNTPLEGEEEGEGEGGGGGGTTAWAAAEDYAGATGTRGGGGGGDGDADGDGGDGGGHAPPSRKRDAPEPAEGGDGDEDEELDDDVKKRLAALKG